MNFVSAILLGLLVVVSAKAQSETDFIVLSPDEIHKVVGPFPAAGSVQAGVDVEILRVYQKSRTQSDCEMAAMQEEATLKTLFGAQNGLLTDGLLTDKEVDELSFVFLNEYGEAGGNAYIAKKMYGRPRPYDSNPKLIPCISKEASGSYPSGHATIARVFARLLAERFPERAEAFLAQGNRVAFNRIIGGVHYPSDVMAGVRLGDYLADKMIERARRRD